MPRKSSIHFKPVSNVRFAVSHSERTDLSEPAYLLPKEHQLDNIVVTGSMSENDLSALFIQQKEGMTGQAKARGSSPFWEGVVVLPNTDGKEQSTNLQSWKKEYEKATGHKVLHMSVHLDEGYLDALGKPQYNPHAHVIVTRMDSKNRVINLDRKQLAQVQDLTASTLQMERGSTLAERQGKRGRAHVPHREFRAQADEKRLGLDKEKVKTARIQKLFQEDTPIISNLKSELAKLKAQYDQNRADFKARGDAKQADYQALKKAHEEAQAELKATKEKVVEMDEYTKKLEADLAAGEDKIAQALIEKAAAIEALVQAGVKSEALLVTAEGHRDAAAKLTSQSNTMTPEVIKTASEPPKQPEAPIPSPHPKKQPVDLFKRLQESWDRMIEWITGNSGKRVEVNTHGDNYGPVVRLDDLHAVQRTGRGLFAIHQLDELDRVPALDDPKMVIRYKDGKGAVIGKSGPGVQI